MAITGYLSDLFDEVNDYTARYGVEFDSKCICTASCSAGCITMALTIIGILGLCGVFGGSSMGWTAVGLGGGILLCTLSTGKLKERLFYIIPQLLIAATFIGLGIAGGLGSLSTAELSGALLGVGLGAGCFLMCGMSAQIARKQFFKQEENITGHLMVDPD